MNTSPAFRRRDSTAGGPSSDLRSWFAVFIALCLLAGAPWGCVPAFLQSKSKSGADREAKPVSTKDGEAATRDKGKSEPVIAGSDSGKAQPATPPEQGDGSENKPAVDGRIAQYDHSKYEERVKKAAKELVAREPDWSYARLCNKTRGEDWWLTLYFQEPKTFYYVRYIWNEIDEKWEKAFRSERKALSQWESNLERSSAGKTCTALDRPSR